LESQEIAGAHMSEVAVVGQGELGNFGTHLDTAPDVAVGSSILFLIPGVWLINSVFDILNENMLVGISRGLNTGLLIICIAIGLFLTLSISNLGLVNV